jgi:metal-responsive CopG/Arc/MetJ family transcriptional regulator
MDYTEYTTVKIPNQLINEVDTYMNTHKEEGFTTRVELIKTALRAFLNNNKKQERREKK